MLPARAEQAGVAAAVNPAASGTPPGLPTRVLSLGADIARNERIATDPGGLTQILFNDGTSLSIGPDADVVIDDYAYDPAKGTGTMALSLGKGALRLIGGRIANADQVTVKTPSATVGIRGGIAGVAVDDQGGTTSYLAFGTNMTVQGANGSSQSVSRPNFTITVTKPGDAPQPPAPLTQTVLQNVSVDPPSGSTGGSNSQPTETTVQNGGSGASNAVTAPPPGAVISQVSSTTTTTRSVNQNVTQSSQDNSTSSSVTAQPGFEPNTTYGPFGSASYRAAQSFSFTTDANGDIASQTLTPYVYTDLRPSAAGSIVRTGGAVIYKAALGLAEIGVWSGGSSTIINQDGTIGATTNFTGPTVFLAAVPTTFLQQSGSITYRLVAATPVVGSFSTYDALSGNLLSSSSAVIPGSRFEANLSAVFGRAGPNSAALTLDGKLTLPGDATISFSEPYLVNYPLSSRQSFFVNYPTPAPITVSGSSRYCGGTYTCVLSVQGYFYGRGGATQVALNYDISGSNADGTVGADLNGAGLFQYASGSAQPGPTGASSAGFLPNAALIVDTFTAAYATPSRSGFGLAYTDGSGFARLTRYTVADPDRQIVDRGGDVYAQVSRIVGSYTDSGQSVFNQAQNQSLHLLLAVPTVTLPTAGTLSYNLIAATAPTYADGYGGPGQFSGQMSASFNPSGASVALSQLAVQMPDARYALQPITIANATGHYFESLNATVASVGASHLCPSGCSNLKVSLRGVFAGPDARRAGLTYTVKNPSGAAGIVGAAVFRVPGAGN